MKRIFLLLFALFISKNLFAANIHEIVFFGDSLSDNGNLYKILKVIPRSPPYYKGRFSNGPTWAEILGKHYQDIYSTTYSIYAYGGATTFAHDSDGSVFAAMNLESEIYEFYASTSANNRGDKLYVIWVGANDYLWEDLADADFLTSQVIDRILWALNNLKSQGAQYFLILNLPDLAKIPYAKANNATERLHFLAEMHNEKLAKAITDFSASNL